MKYTTLLIAIVLVFIQAVSGFRANYTWSRDALSYWNLADKSSSLPAKTEYLVKFIAALKKANLAEHNAVFFKTPDNSRDSNIAALETLEARLNEIKGMDQTSFQYNTAISQITAQEQGEAGKIISELEGCYMKSNCPIAWGWWGFLFALSYVFLGLITWWYFANDSDY